MAVGGGALEAAHWRWGVARSNVVAGGGALEAWEGSCGWGVLFLFSLFVRNVMRTLVVWKEIGGRNKSEREVICLEGDLLYMVLFLNS